MVIYHTVTYYHILKSAVHKLRFHPDEDGAILVPIGLERKCSGLLNFTAQDAVFSNVCYYAWHNNPPGGDVELKAKEIDAQLEEWFGKDYLSQFSEINICSAAYYFGIWAVEKKLHFHWFEEADGFLSQPHFIQDADRTNNPVRYKIAEELGNYTGDNPCVLSKVVKMSAQLPGFHDDLAVDFDVLREMKLLSKEQQQILLDFFDVPKELSFPHNSALMLTQHFSNMNMLTYEEQALIYQLTCDYYLEGYHLFFKWHPTDITDYPSFMEDVTMISGSFPAELLTLVIQEPLKVCGSIESSGTKNLAPICDRILLFKREYITDTFMQNHRYYFCLKLMEQFPDRPVCTIGMSQSHLENLLEFGDVSVRNGITYLETAEEAMAIQAPQIYLVGSPKDTADLMLEEFLNNRNPEDMMVFLNSNDENAFWQIRGQIPYIVKEIRIRALEPELYGNETGCERLFIFSQDKSLLKKVNEMKYIKKLLQTGVETAVFAEQDKDVQIAALKGMLKATEIQLHRYMAENKQLKEMGTDTKQI